MQLFIGGAYAGKRAAIRERLTSPQWHSAYDGEGLEAWRIKVAAGRCLVLEGWEEWLRAELASEPDDDRVRQCMVDELESIQHAESVHGMQIVLIMLEMGRGIVPLAAEDRRWRDLAGWLAQDAAARCERVWHVWNGLARSLT
ncbi:bifunctional adenosylcobinamide kinase/adenosylcobinamide-phosphate guanylyltransferase [Litchfieldella rifensis]|uniref:Adenosylcobinamide kinase n=1 Tax=Litchfieldella rifensis TaxID=762643 RepID=A0ABV7LMS5_9GAMM